MKALELGNRLLVSPKKWPISSSSSITTTSSLLLAPGGRNRPYSFLPRKLELQLLKPQSHHHVHPKWMSIYLDGGSVTSSWKEIDPYRSKSSSYKTKSLLFLTQKRYSSSSSIHANIAKDNHDSTKTFEEWEKAIIVQAQNDDLPKIEESMDILNEHFQNYALGSDTISIILDTYTRVQQGLLQKLDHLPVVDPLTCDDLLPEDSFQMLPHHETILNQVWDVTNDMDDLLQEFGAQRNMNLERTHYDSVIQAWDALLRACNRANLHKKGIPQRATYQLEFLERLALNQNYNKPQLAPTIDMYNTVLNMWSISQEHFLSLRAESIVRKFGWNPLSSHHGHSNHPSQGTKLSDALGGVQPNVETHRIMIRAWCRTANDVVSSKTKIGSAAFNATGYLIRMQNMMERGQREFEPSMDDYTMVFRAWAKAGHAKYSGKRALSLLKKMESLATSDNSHTSIRPDVTCYKCVLQSFSESKAQYVEGLGYEAESIISRMEENGLVPDSDCFTYAIQTWSNSACQNELSEKQIYEAAFRAQKLLNQKHKMHYRSGTIEVKTSTIDYNNVMRAWSRSSSKEAYQRVEELLSNMEKLYAEGDSDLRPNHQSYFHAINVLGRNPDIGKKIHLVQSFLSRMKLQNDNGNQDCAPNISCFNAAIRVCGSRNFQNCSEDELQNGLRCMISLIQEIDNTSGVSPNSDTYHLALDAFSVLLDKKSPKFSRVVASLFNRCCNEGLVDDKVIKTFHRVAPYDLYRRSVLTAASMDREIDGTPILDTLFLPDEWTRNITGVRQRIPLAVDGRFVRSRSKSVSEHKMRRLRKKEKKLMLQGGRLG